ncbi:acetyltransferase (GNAT) family protein [Mucilaginibacter yixingensis]|uniref:Acetyltransferase (GNAT) family protein n=1 Tax=Mucilaginibacter yixingensis TaxID=1295612 RepID=A0A2T5JCW1_9SPHI|nr:GNAT family N-acetyltransferase [Mucilaginibacter yixingensis]PTQ99602.1 acetyltransferase (GNAT) family protein [Mucilaginibacter yixingensis]
MGYRSFTVQYRKEWDDYVNRSLLHDVFHSCTYQSLNTEGEPLLFVYEEGDMFIALPVVKRKVEGTDFYDMTSVYGYCGPISNVNITELSEVILADFTAAFKRFMTDQRAICIFSRLHPFIDQCHLLENIGGVVENGSTLYMDLSSSIDDQRSGYEKRLSRQVRQLRNKGYLIKEATNADEIKAFVDVYHKNMDRLHAAPMYYFDEAYFTTILELEGFDSKLLLVYDGTVLTCGALVLLSDTIIRNHLSATSPDYLSESPSKLLTDEISVMGRRLGKKIFHLGGGVGGKEDSLFEFKKRFSNLQVKDHIWRYVNDREAYDAIVAKAGADIDLQSGYFPLYRQPKEKRDPIFQIAN